jgi:UDP-N-acetylmuramate dehydrogenase
MNAGGHGSDIAATLLSATVVDLAIEEAVAVEREPASLQLTYRSSALRPTEVVIAARFLGVPGSAEAGAETIREIVRWRREHQPGGQNAGSVFVNPTAPLESGGPVRSAGWLIEQAGLKGRRLGTAEVSPKHANFIQADPGGAADDVVALMRLVQATVEDRFGVRLRTENRLVGFVDSRPLQEG